MKGSYTALVTPFKGESVDCEAIEHLVTFQIQNGITGILAVGTTGESPVLTWNEHNLVVENVRRWTKGKSLCIAGTGSNNTMEAIDGTRHAASMGVDAVLLVDPYYNGPSSLEIRKEYVAPVAKAFPDMQIIPYLIPGRTGTQLLPEDLALLHREFKNVSTVKEATGNPNNMRRIRECCGAEISILSGDDGLTFGMMTDPEIKASGVISVVSNIAPKAVAQMVAFVEAGKKEQARKLATALTPLSDLVTVKTKEMTPFGEVECRARNPLATKTLMQILGMPVGPCRRPLGKMTRKGLEKVIATAKKVWAETPEILKPAADFFSADIEERLNTPEYWKGLYYEGY
jgi:4-hydroxy-tetrahydrodipicolinate synthase